MPIWITKVSSNTRTRVKLHKNACNYQIGKVYTRVITHTLHAHYMQCPRSVHKYYTQTTRILHACTCRCCNPFDRYCMFQCDRIVQISLLLAPPSSWSRMTDTKLRLKNKHARKNGDASWLNANLTCVKSNWPISNLHSESEHKYSNCTRTIAGSPSLTCPLAFDRVPFESKYQNNPYGEPVCRLWKWHSSNWHWLYTCTTITVFRVSKIIDIDKIHTCIQIKFYEFFFSAC